MPPEKPQGKVFGKAKRPISEEKRLMVLKNARELFERAKSGAEAFKFDLSRLTDATKQQMNQIISELSKVNPNAQAITDEFHNAERKVSIIKNQLAKIVGDAIKSYRNANIYGDEQLKHEIEDFVLIYGTKKQQIDNSLLFEINEFKKRIKQDYGIIID